jgi:hypothetical protein
VADLAMGEPSDRILDESTPIEPLSDKFPKVKMADELNCSTDSLSSEPEFYHCSCHIVTQHITHAL